MTDPLPLCRCQHPEAAHVWSAVHTPGQLVHTGTNVCHCGCHEYRPVLPETADWADLDGPGWNTLWEGNP